MAGADTWRGIAFQAALTASRALDVLEGQVGDWMDVDAGADVIDYSSGNDSEVLLVGQAKTRVEPYTWTPGEIAEVIRRLIEEASAPEARLDFATDGSLSPDSASKFVPALDRARDGQASDDDWAYLDGYGLGTESASALQRVSIITREDSPPALLDRAVRRVRALADLVAPISDDEAELRVHRLLDRIDECGSSGSDAASRLTRDKIAQIIGVEPAVIDAATPWSDEVADEYRARILEAQSLDALVELDAQVEATTPTVSPLGALAVPGSQAEQRSDEPVLNLLDRDCLVVGVAGAGKSQSMKMLRRQAAEEGLVPVLLAPRTYQAGTLAAVVRAAVSRVLVRVVAPATGGQLLARQETVLIIDGASELAEPQMRRALARDVDELRQQIACPTVVVSGRSISGLRPLDLPAYRLRELDGDRRRTIAAELLGGDASALVTELEHALSDAIGNPLLFTMALRLAAEGHAVNSVASVYAGFVDRLAQAVGHPDELDTPLAVTGVACAALIVDGRFSLDRWAWLSELERAIAALQDRGFVGHDLPAIEVLNVMAAIGLFVPDEELSAYSLWHDSFRDWLAARAIGNGLASLPASLSRRWANVASHLAEAGLCDEEFLDAAASDLIVATAAASRERSEADDLSGKTSRVFARLVADHLSLARRQDWEGWTVVAHRTAWGTSAYLLRAGVTDPANAAAGVRLGENAGPLRVAVTLFLALLRSMVEVRPTAPQRAPEDVASLAHAIEAHFIAQREAMERLVADIVPTLAEAVIEHLGWRGLRGRLTADTPDDVRHGHHLSYSYDADGVRVVVGGAPIDDLHSSTLGADFIRESPEKAASAAVAQALTSLLPGFGRL